MIKHREIFSVAWPYTLSMATAFIIQAVDSIMVAPLGKTALAALAITGTAAFLPNAVTMGLITSVQKRVATAANKETADQALSSGLILGACVPLPFALAYGFFSRSIAGIFAEGATADLAALFLQIIAPSFIFASMNQALNGFWIGSLKSGTRLVITLCVMAVNVTGNWLLIPSLGFSGAAISSAVAIFSGFLLNLVLTYRLMAFRWRAPRRSEIFADLKTILGISLNQVSLALSLNAAIFIVGLIGVDALAVANVIGTLALPALYLGIGYGTATGTFLAKSLAKRNPAEAKAIANKGLLQVLAISCLFALVIWTFSSSIRNWFFVDADVYELAKIPFMLLGLLYVIDGICCALQRYHFLTGGVAFSILTMSTVQWLLFIPAAWAGAYWFGITYPTYLTWHLGQRLLVSVALYMAWFWRTQLSTTYLND